MGINVTTQASAADPAITEAIAGFALSAAFASLPGDVQPRFDLSDASFSRG